MPPNAIALITHSEENMKTSGSDVTFLGRKRLSTDGLKHSLRKMQPELNKDGYITNTEALTCDDVCGEKVLCPACGHPFKSWPEGWDGHATGQKHFCIGLKAMGDAERKAEFKARFPHLFRGKTPKRAKSR
jgi:hypothetical protein